jgi:hypothetical protein
MDRQVLNGSVTSRLILKLLSGTMDMFMQMILICQRRTVLMQPMSMGLPNVEMDLVMHMITCHSLLKAPLWHKQLGTNLVLYGPLMQHTMNNSQVETFSKLVIFTFQKIARTTNANFTSSSMDVTSQLRPNTHQSSDKQVSLSGLLATMLSCFSHKLMMINLYQ